jgi:outer membrane protein assembly factor BamB
MMAKTRPLAFALLLATSYSQLSAADWPSFRGPQGNGYADESKVPLEWSKEKNISWRAALPRPGNSSPIVSNGCVFVTCAEDRDGLKRSLYCFDRRDGKQRWVRTVEYDEKEPTHDTNPYCGSTPAADGKRVVVWHSSAGIYCYDFEGKELWGKSLGEFQHIWGYGTSPIIYQNQVIMHCAPGKQVFVTALDLATGETVWKTDEPMNGDGTYRPDKSWMGSWTTPIITDVEGRDQIICSMPTRVVSYDPADGKILWFCEGLSGRKGDLAYSSPVIAADVCVAIGGFGGPGMAFRLGGMGNITESNRLWRTESNPQSIGSGVVIGGFFYRPNEAQNASIDCMEPKTGKIVWRENSIDGKFWGSIVYAAGRCYVTNQNGETIVFNPKPDAFELLAKNDLGEVSNSTPAVSNGQIFLRTHKALYCVSEK